MKIGLKMTELPNKINVLWVRTYDTKAIAKEIADFEDIDIQDVTDSEIISAIELHAFEELATTAESTVPDFFFQDEDGEDLDY